MKSKKVLLSFVLIFIFTTLLPTVVLGASEKYDYLSYEKYSDHVEITNIYDNAGEVNIPSVIEGQPVTVICDEACANNLGITSVSIPDSVKSIGKMAFYNCQNLKNVNIGSKVSSIGDGAFSACGSLNITVQNGNSYFCDADGVLFDKRKTKLIAYAKDKIQPNYTVPSGVKSIGYAAFDGCSALKSVSIPDSVTGIEDNAFYNCGALTAVNIPKNTTSIGESAFESCKSLTDIVIPKSLTQIGVMAFSDCGRLNITVDPQNSKYSDIDGVLFNKDKTELITYAKDKIQQSYTVPSGVKSVGDSAFAGCGGLTSVDMGGATRIGNNAFGECVNLKNVKITDSVTSIGDWAFYYCNRLTSITIPSSVESIGEGAFVYNDGSFSPSKLEILYYEGTEEQWKNLSSGQNLSLYKFKVCFAPKVTISDVSIENGDITLSIDAENVSAGGELVAVGYRSENKIMAAAKVENGKAVLPADGVNTVKVLCWDSLDGMRPLCEEKIININ